MSFAENDSMIIAATVFTKALDEWKAEREELALEEAAAFRRRLSVIMNDALELFRVQTQKHGEAAASKAAAAVEKALAIDDKDSQWKYRLQGTAVGVALMLLLLVGVALMLLLLVVVKIWL